MTLITLSFSKIGIFLVSVTNFLSPIAFSSSVTRICPVSKTFLYSWRTEARKNGILQKQSCYKCLNPDVERILRPFSESFIEKNKT